MVQKTFFIVVPFLFLFIFNYSFTQSPTLVINEVSNGTDGNKEYIELLVIGSPTNPCENPETLDIRNWIIDDNNGFLGSGSGNGIATGAFRFKDDTFWASIPVGTIILIYNKDDYEVSLITDDLSHTDGNCKIVIPHNSNLLESQSVSPTINDSSYPTTGWSIPTQWGPLGLRNGGDGVLIYSANNTTTPVFSLAYGDINISNATVGFSGSGSQTVYAMENLVDDNIYNVNNWSKKTANNITQTPGLPNNPANETFISTLNNGCQLSSASILPNNLDVLCIGETVQLTATPSGGTWTSSDPSIASINSNGLVTALNNGTVTIEYNNGVCSASVTVVISSNVIASFTANPMQTNLNNTTINFDNQSTGATTYIWDFGDGSPTESTENPSHTFPDNVTGNYIVTLISLNNNGCSDTTQITISIDDDVVDEEVIEVLPMIYLFPNIFTPNGDGKNEFFKLINPENIIELNIIILNRWGNVVFESNDIDFIWNGKIMNTGEECTEGVYFYKATLTDAYESKEETGYVHLAR